MVTQEQILSALKQVDDPELHHNVVDLGIIRAVEIEEGGVVNVDVQLTSPYCPFAAQIVDSIRGAVARVPGVTQVEIDWLCAGDV